MVKLEGDSKIQDLEEKINKLILENTQLKSNLAVSQRIAENSTTILYRIIIQPELKVEYINSAITEITGFTPEEHYSNPEIWQDIIHPDDIDLLQIPEEDMQQTILLRYITKKKDVIWIEQRNNFLIKNNGACVVLEGSARQVTEQKEVEIKLAQKTKDLKNKNEELQKLNLELEIAKDNAQEAERLQTQFLNNISHEIRTPLNGILGFTELLIKPDLSQEQRLDYYAVVRNSSDRLIGIIDKILQASKLDANIKNVKKDLIFIENVFREVKNTFAIKAEEKNLNLIFENKYNTENKSIITDHSRLLIILHHIVENAIVYTDSGFVKVSVEVENDRVLFSVIDSGIGIQLENQKSIFEKFTHENVLLSTQKAGLGLGLTIARENAVLLGGDIQVISDKGKGSTFILDLPIEEVVFEEEMEEADMQSGIILIAEDDDINFHYIETILLNQNINGISILRATNGKQAVDFCKEYDNILIVLMDIRMSVMNGNVATKIIRKMRPNLPIIAQTAYASVEDKIEAIVAGADDYITKPISKDFLLEKLGDYILLD